jgi:hypothetical protein
MQASYWSVAFMNHKACVSFYTKSNVLYMHIILSLFKMQYPNQWNLDDKHPFQLFWVSQILNSAKLFWNNSEGRRRFFREKKFSNFDSEC